MKFIYPSFLWALLLVLIPIIIHFVNFRRHQTVYFSNVNLLKRVRKESKRKSKLKQLIIMCCRALAIALLVIGFAKPYFPVAGIEMQHAENVVCIYIDNSFSMNAETSEGLALENAKSKALHIANAEKPGSRFVLFTNDLQDRQHRMYTQNEIVELITDVKSSHLQASFTTINARINDVLEKAEANSDKNIYFISDFQRYATNLDEFEPLTDRAYNFVPLKGNIPSNLSIDSCWFENPAHFPGQVEELMVRVTNRGTVDFPQLPINLYLNDSLKGLANIKLDQGESTVVKLSFANSQAPIVHGRIEISDYPIVYDNVFYINYKVENKKKVLATTTTKALVETTSQLTALFLNDEYIELDVQSLERLQISKITSNNCVILAEPEQLSSGVSEALVQYVAEGGTLVLVPRVVPGADLLWGAMIDTLGLGRIGLPDTSKVTLNPDLYASDLFKDVFRETSANAEMPQIKSRLRMDANINAQPVMRYDDGAPALLHSKYKNGNAFLFTFQALSGQGNNFAKHLLFVPTFYNLALRASFNSQLFYTIGLDRLIPVQNPFETLPREVVMTHLQSNVQLSPSVKQYEGNVLGLYPGNDLQAGNYAMKMNDELVDGAAFNYNLRESELDFFSPDELESFMQQAGVANFNVIDAEAGRLEVALADLDSGRQFWKWFIAFALLFLVAEALVIRFWP
jgi:hypothetical protein